MRIRFAVLALALLVGFLPTLSASQAAAAGPREDLAAAGESIQRALVAAHAGDIATAASEYHAFENRWFDIEDGVRETSRESYRAIEAEMSKANVAFGQQPPKEGVVIAALSALDAENQAFIAARSPIASATAIGANSRPASVTVLTRLLAETMQAVRANDWTRAAQRWDRFGATWVEVEGEIKTRSAADYRRTEDDMARVQTAINNRSVEAAGLLEGMTARLQPYESGGSYGPFDATIIIFREGMEAMLVVVALLAFLKRSGNSDKSSYIWYGAGAGLFASIAFGIAINAILGKAFSGENRELMEGVTGLFAAAMLLYVSYWLHSKSSLGTWQRYISAQTTQALATGSLLGLAALSFLAVFREGGETVLFFLGMAGNITTGDLMLGLAVGTVILAVIGVALSVAGLRIPLRPFFVVASVLTFYLCVKFLGTGVHALQVADVLSAQTSDALASNETLGLYPTWQSTLPQLVLVTLALAVWARGLLADRQVRRASAEQPAGTTAH